MNTTLTKADENSNRFNIFYEFGILPGFISFPLELTDSTAIFYSKDKSKSLEIKYSDIDYIWKVPFFLFWQVEPLNWKIHIILKRNILDDYTEEEKKDIAQWFPPIPKLTPNKIPFYIEIYCSKRNLLLDSFKKCSVQVSDRFINKQYWH